MPEIAMERGIVLPTEWTFSFYQHPEDVPGTAQKRFQWCIGPKAFKELKEKGCDSVQVLIITVDEDGKERRQCAPLSDMQALVPFRKSGQHWVFACVIAMRSKERSAKALRSYLLSRSLGVYSVSLIDKTDDSDKRLPVEDWKIDLSESLSEVDFENAKVPVEVSPEYFAERPPGWLDWWLKFFNADADLVDTCAMRKRLMFAFSIQPFLVIGLVTLGAIVWLITAFAASIYAFVMLYPGINWYALFHLFSGEVENEDVFRGVYKKSWLVYDGYNLRPYGPMLTFLLPWVQGLMVLGSLAIGVVLHLISDKPLYIAVGITYAVIATVYLGVTGLFSYELRERDAEYWDIGPEKKSKRGQKRAREQAEKEKQMEREKRLLEERLTAAYGDIVCGDQTARRARAPRFTFQNPRPAIKRWYQELKLNQCKPYAER